VLGRSKQMRDVASAASTVHGWESKQSGVNVLAQNAVVITDEQIADLRRRLARLRGRMTGGLAAVRHEPRANRCNSQVALAVRATPISIILSLNASLISTV
jgi:hypothetical protein